MPTPTSRTPVLQVGDPRLRVVSKPVVEFSSDTFANACTAVLEELRRFREEHGFGRAIAAPQLGIAQRMIALNLPHWADAPFVMVNPEIVWSSDETFTLWDDCMSFPFLLVKVARHRSISVKYQNQDGDAVQRDDLSLADAELLQHEIDHLDGVLALDRALDADSLVSRETFESMKDYFAGMVDYTIS